MNTFHYILAYHFDNHLTAAEIDQKLNRLGFQFDHIHTGNAVVHLTIAERIQNSTKPFILLITDNFLKDENCLHKLLEIVSQSQKNNRQFILILAEGFSVDPISNQIKSIDTKLSTIGDILYYINYWQDKYLQLRKKYLDNEKSLQVVDDKLKVLREIAAEIGELLHKLRKIEPVGYSDFIKDDFYYFFAHSGNLESYQSYKKMAEYDEKDNLIEQKINNLVGNTDKLSINEEKVSPIEDYEMQNIVSETNKEEHETVSKEKILDSTFNKNINGSNQETDSDLLEKLKAYKNGLLKEETLHIEKSELKEIEPNTEIIQDIYKTKEEFEAILKLDEEVTSQLGNLINSKFENSLLDENDYPNEEEDWDEEEKDISTLKNYEESLVEAIKEDPENIETRLQLIKYLIVNPDNFSRTADQLEQVLKLDKNNVEAIYLLATLSQGINHPDLARTYFEKLINIQPDFPGVYFTLAELIETHFPKDFPIAAEYYKKAYQHDTTNIKALEKRAQLLYKQLRKSKKAAKTYKKIIKLLPYHPTAYYYLSEISLEQGEKEKAVEYYHKAKVITKRTKILEEASNLVEHRIEAEPKIEIKMQNDEFSKKTNVASKEVNSYVCITGATSGIGNALAHLLASKSYDLILTGRRIDRLKNLANELIQKYNITVEILQFDIRDFQQSANALGSLGDKLDKIDILINNAGLAMGLDYIYEANVDHWETMIDTNIKGLLFMTRLVTPSMVKKKRGHIINIGSTAGKEVYPKGNVYCATKFAVDALTKAFRQDLYQHNIRVSQICPGHTENTEFAITRFEGDKEKASIYNDFNPLKAQNIADIIYFIITQPPNVNIQDVLVMGTQQASSTMVNRSGRIYDLKA